MAWAEDFMALATWGLQYEDLRHRMVFAAHAEDLPTTPGIAWALEASAVLAIYDAALRKGYMQGTSIGYEWAYPRAAAQNPKRADLVFKDIGRGTNWKYLEVKYYGPKGKAHVDGDIAKLRTISNRVQRWMFAYRVRPAAGKSQTLGKLLDHVSTLELHESSFSTVTATRTEGACDMWLARV